MARVLVTPEAFTMVKFDHPRLVELVEEVADGVGIPADLEVRVEVDEGSPLGRTKLVSVEPVALWIQGGALENPKVPRTLSDRSVRDVLARLLFRAKDRLDPSFAGAPEDDDLSLQQHTAWDTYAVGRAERLGYKPSKQRRLYHFRNRHGFSDVADTVFDRLWSADALTWADLEAACAETAAAREPEPAA